MEILRDTSLRSAPGRHSPAARAAASTRLHRNVGPAWGPNFIQSADRLLPWFVLRAGLRVGALVALVGMPDQRRRSRDFLSLVRGRKTGWLDSWNHFTAFARLLTLRLRVARGAPHSVRLRGTGGEEFEPFAGGEEAAFFGTFHFGQSDLLGFILGERFGRKIHMLRLKMDNSEDLARLQDLFGKWISFVWVDDPAHVPFAIKGAVESGGSLAMQCDRFEFSAKTEAFEFLGARRVFPFTIYHLALIFERPVVFCIGIPGASRDETVIHASPVFRPDPQLGREENLARARTHFQAVLATLEQLVRANPELWFNFQPLNPSAESAPPYPR